MKNMKYLVIAAAVLAAPIMGQTANNRPFQKIGQMPVSPLTPAEQQFAAQLSSLHKQIFTTVFTPQLRQEAMTLMSPDAQSNLGDNGSITADMAVEEVVSNHRDMPMNGMPSGTQGNSSSMPTQPSSNKAGKYWTN